MSTNIYEYRETVWFNKATHHWGWHVSTSVDDKSIAMLSTKKDLNKLVSLVLRRMEKEGHEPTHASGYIGEVEACFVLSQVAGGENPHWFHEVLTDMAPDRTELWEFLMDIAKEQEVKDLIWRHS